MSSNNYITEAYLSSVLTRGRDETLIFNPIAFAKLRSVYIYSLTRILIYTIFIMGHQNKTAITSDDVEYAINVIFVHQSLIGVHTWLSSDDDSDSDSTYDEANDNSIGSDSSEDDKSYVDENEEEEQEAAEADEESGQEATINIKSISEAIATPEESFISDPGVHHDSDISSDSNRAYLAYNSKLYGEDLFELSDAGSDRLIVIGVPNNFILQIKQVLENEIIAYDLVISKEAVFLLYNYINDNFALSYENSVSRYVYTVYVLSRYTTYTSIHVYSLILAY